MLALLDFTVLGIQVGCGKTEPHATTKELAIHVAVHMAVEVPINHGRLG